MMYPDELPELTREKAMRIYFDPRRRYDWRIYQAAKDFLEREYRNRRAAQRRAANRRWDT